MISAMAVLIQTYSAFTEKRETEAQLRELKEAKKALDGPPRLMREQLESLNAQVNSHASRLKSIDDHRKAQTENIMSSHSNEPLIKEIDGLIKEKSKLTNTLEKTKKAREASTKKKNNKGIRRSHPSPKRRMK